MRYNSAIHNQRIVVNIPKIQGEASLCHESKTVLRFSIQETNIVASPQRSLFIGPHQWQVRPVLRIRGEGG